MKILILSGPFSNFSKKSYGAVEKFWFQMSLKFKELGNQVIIISKKNNNESDSKFFEGILFKKIKGYSYTENIFFRLLLDFLYTIRAAIILPKELDVIITNSFWSPIVFPLITKKKTKIYVDVARMPKGQMLFYRFATRFRAWSKAVRKQIIKEISKSQVSKIRVIPPSLPFKVTKKIDIKNKKKNIVFFGRIHEEKGLELFIEALNKINLYNWKVKIIGPWKIKDGGSGIKYRKKLIKKIKNKSISIKNPVFGNKIYSIYEDTSIFVYPSLAKNETFGLSVIEFMSYGAAPIVSNLECFKDFIKNNFNGLIFKHNQNNSAELLSKKIKNLIEDHKLRFKISKNALNVRNTHSIDNIAQTFLNEFKK